MTFFARLGIALLSLFTIGCSNAGHHPAAAPQASPVAAPVAVPELDDMPDLQTLTENHQILLIRISGDLSKVSADTRSKITTLTKDFNAALAQFKTNLEHRNDLHDQLKAKQAISVSGDAAASESAALQQELKAANEATVQSKERYEELSRQFSQLIEEVKKVRSH